MNTDLAVLRAAWKARVVELGPLYYARRPVPEPCDRCLTAGVAFAHVGVAATCYHPKLPKAADQ